MYYFKLVLKKHCNEEIMKYLIKSAKLIKQKVKHILDSSDVIVEENVFKETML